MSDILLRVELHNEPQARAILRQTALPWVGEQLKQGNELVAEFRLLDDAITDAQRKYLHGVVLTEMALYARPNGQQFPMPVWKEHMRKTLLGYKTRTFTDPMTGRKSKRRVRISTNDLGIAGMAKYIDKVIAFASTELGLTISEPLPAHLRPQRRKAIKREVVDQDTGEILELEAA